MSDVRSRVSLPTSVRSALRTFCAATISWGVATIPVAARADEPCERCRPLAVGFNVDLLPTALSAANGKVGYPPQVWLGVGHARLRFVGAHLELGQHGLYDRVWLHLAFRRRLLPRPLGGAHVVLNPQTVQLGRFEYKPFPLQGEVSLKVGWFTPI